MAALPYMQLYVADYLADTAHLSTIEHGAYLLLIFNYWQRGESFKAKDEQALNKRLASVARLSSDEWNEVREALSEFFSVSDAEWRHERIECDLDAVNAKSAKAAAAGRASAAARGKGGQPDTEVKSSERSTDVQQTLNHKDKDTDTYIPPKPPAAAGAFDKFWAAYPKKVGKDAARRRFASRKPNEQLLDDMLRAIAVQRESDQWKRGYVPNPATWLNEGRWQDEATGGQQAELGRFV